MALRQRVWAPLFILALVVALVFVAFQQSSGGSDRDVARLESELEIAEKRLDQIDQRLEAIAEIQTLKDSIAGIQGGFDELKKQVDALPAADAEMAKKIDSLSEKVTSLSGKIDGLTTKVNAVDQRIALLETRYNDHLRKYHSGA